MKCANLGIDEPELLGGWFTSLKKGASRVASATISVGKASGIPGVSQLANVARSTGEQLEASGLIPKTLRTGSAGSSSSAAPETVAYAPAKDNTLMYVGLGALALFLLVRRK